MGLLARLRQQRRTTAGTARREAASIGCLPRRRRVLKQATRNNIGILRGCPLRCHDDWGAARSSRYARSAAKAARWEPRRHGHHGRSARGRLAGHASRRQISQAASAHRIRIRSGGRGRIRQPGRQRRGWRLLHRGLRPETHPALRRTARGIRRQWRGLHRWRRAKARCRRRRRRSTHRWRRAHGRGRGRCHRGERRHRRKSRGSLRRGDRGSALRARTRHTSHVSRHRERRVAGVAVKLDHVTHSSNSPLSRAILGTIKMCFAFKNRSQSIVVLSGCNGSLMLWLLIYSRFP